jgi:GNAT superfamily N-acetyltransferase
VSLPPWHEQAITQGGDRAAFGCGVAALDIFLKKYARQSHERGGAKTFLAVEDANPSSILGFYSLNPGCLAYDRVPLSVSGKLGRHEVPVFRLARLAVDQRWHGQGLGGLLLLAAGRRCLRVAAEVGGVALWIDAKTEKAANWYKSYGAIPLLDSPLTLIIPLSTIANALAEAPQTQ